MNEELTELCGMVEDVSFRNDGNGYTILDLCCNDELVTVVGIMPEVAPGEELTLTGKWTDHPKYGRQFKSELCTRSMPSEAASMLKYLSSGTVKGIGPVTAEKIVSAFGENTFEILESSPERLAELKGISREKAKEIGKSFKEQFAVRQVMIYLERFGMTPSECVRVFNSLGAGAVDIISANPYVLCGEGVHMDFARVDDIADRLHEPVDSQFRIDAGIIFVVKHNIENGHTCIPREKLIAPACRLLEIDEDCVQEAIDRVISSGRLVSSMLGEREFLFMPLAYKAEQMIARRLAVMLKYPPAGRPTLQKDIDKIEKKYSIKFEEKQRLAIADAVEKGILILTGGPGTGKTTTLNGIMQLYEEQGLNVVLAAPTGRAAKRMSEVTGREAKTIHRLLEVKWDDSDNRTFGRNMTNPIDADALIVDELSMVDIFLFASLLDALPLGCRLVLVGDSDQLPPVGAGNVLQDMIKSELLPVVELKEVFRQAMESLIVTNAHRIVGGEMPIADRTDGDFFHMERRSLSAALSTVSDLCAARLPAAYGYSPLEDIQILCPSKKGELGTVNINRVMQERLNPPAKFKEEVRIGAKLLREGDKVMQVKNNYDICWDKGEESGTGVFNGDIGVVETVNVGGGYIKINFDGKIAVYGMENANELELAYAVTVHKSQGSEYEAVIMPVLGAAPQLCYRNLLYTAVTRAKKIAITVGSLSAIEAMVRNNKKMRRYSALKFFLTGESQ